MSILTERMSTTDLVRFKGEMADFAATRGLQVYAPGTLTCFVPTHGPITSEDRGAVLDWLCRSEKVFMVHILRRPRSLGEVGLSTFKSAESNEEPSSRPELQRVADAPDLRVPDEDLSQEPAIYADETSQVQPELDDWDRTPSTTAPAQNRRSGNSNRKASPRQASTHRRAGVRAQEKRHGR
jgi:hypothetical protein